MKRNPLLDISWETVKLLSLDAERCIITIRVEGGSPKEYPFESREEMDEAFHEWCIQGDSVNRVSG